MSPKKKEPLNNKAKKQKSKNSKKKLIVSIILTVILVIIVIYGAYKIYELIKEPTNIFVVEHGSLYLEEDIVRICYKK